MMHPDRFARRAITLVEVLVVIAIIGVLIGLLVPAVMAIRERASVSQCQNNIRQVGVAFRGYEAMQGRMPPYSTGFPPGTPYGNWLGYILPYLDSSNSDQTIKSVFPCPDCDGQKNMVPATGLSSQHVAVLACPSDPSGSSGNYWGTTNYLANWYALNGSPNGGYYEPAKALATLRNGLSNTVVFAEAYKECSGLQRMSLTSIWYHNFGITQQAKPSDDPRYLPNDYTLFQVRPTTGDGPNACDKWRTQTPHSAMNVCLADITVRSVRPDISAEVWKRLLKTPSVPPREDEW
jgi:prepilin-type N-terminal cleavage/methylation domain-containing protein